jgi:PAS domain S-box-containing protein
VHPEDVERAVDSLVETRMSGASLTEYRIRHKDGHYLWVDDARRLIRDPTGQPVEMIGVWTDITERKRAEEIVRQASGSVVRRRRRRIRYEMAILVTATVAIFIVAVRSNCFGTITRWIQAHGPDELNEIILPTFFMSVGLAVFAFRRWRETELALTGHLQVQAALGLLHDELDRQVRQRTEQLKTANQALTVEIAGHQRTEIGLKEAGRVLKESEERFRQLAENIHEVFWITDAVKHEVLYVSPAYEAIWGRSCASLYAAPETWLEAIRPEDRDAVRRARATKQDKGTYADEYRILRPDGAERWIRDRAFPVHGADGSVTRCVGVAEDITESKKLQEQFFRVQRMEAIGTLAGGIAHDLNNILAPVLMAPALLKEYARSDHERRLLDMIEQSAQRGSHIVRQLLTFSRGTGGERVAVKLSPLINDMVSIMRETFPKNIEIEDAAPPNLYPVLGDPTQIHQVIMNLCVNARDAMPEGGVLSVSAKNVELTAAEVETHPSAKPGPHVLLSVADTGEGIAPAILDRIFDPFFTTKSPTKGTGLGLSTVLGIIRSHHGFVTVVSRLGHGTTFTIHLPAAPDSVENQERLADAPPNGHGELILVVDDEASIRTATRLFLQEHGYRVVTANDGAEGLATFVENRGDVKLVLTDLMMPVMGGVTLIRAVHVLEPTVKVLATSGLTDQGGHDELEAVGVDGILAKPCNPDELLNAIGRQLSPDECADEIPLGVT